MSMVVSIVTISFLLEAILSNFISVSTMLFSPLCTLVSLIIVYPFFYHKTVHYYEMALLTGFLYDLVYTNTFCLHAFLFFIIALFVHQLNQWISNRFFNVILISFIVILVYRVLEYLILVLIGYTSFHLETFLSTTISSFLLNLIYCGILYFIVDFWSHKRHILKMN